MPNALVDTDMQAWYDGQLAVVQKAAPLPDLRDPFVRTDGRVWVPAMSKPGVPTWRWATAKWWRLAEAGDAAIEHLRKAAALDAGYYQRLLRGWLAAHGREQLPAFGHYAPEYDDQVIRLAMRGQQCDDVTCQMVHVENIWSTQLFVERDQVGAYVQALLSGHVVDDNGLLPWAVRFRGDKNVILTDGHHRLYAATVLDWERMPVNVMQLDVSRAEWRAMQDAEERQRFVLDVLDEAIEILRDNRKVVA